MICPSCRQEYGPGFTECFTCGAHLVHELPDVVPPGSSPEVAGRSVPCPVCDGGEFDAYTALLDARAMTFIGVLGPNRPVDLFICKGCGHVMWFAQ